MGRGKEVLTLPILQSRIARDPTSYKDEFLIRLRHFGAQCDLVNQQPDAANEEFVELATFLANTASKFGQDGQSFVPLLVSLLEQNATQLDADVRKRLTSAVMILRARGLIPASQLLQLLLSLLRVPDKGLRQQLLQRIVADIRSANKKTKNHKMNTALQHVLSKLVAEGGPAARLALGMLVELYRRGVWNDTRTVNIIADTAVSADSRLAAIALQFFIAANDAAVATGVGKKEESSDDEPESIKKLRIAVQFHAKSGKHRAKKMRKMLEHARRKRITEAAPIPDSTALRLLHDPHTFAEKLLARCRSGGTSGTIVKWETKLLMLEVASRCIAVHKLVILRFYPLVTAYLQPHQPDVTRLLVIAAQGTHDLIPPDALEPLVRAIADRFISDKSRPEAVAAGLNTVRAICQRNPFALQPDLLRDLAQYKNDKDKAVSSGARALIVVYRAANPQMLAKKDRGRPGAGGDGEGRQYGESRPAAGVAGAELLRDRQQGDAGDEWDEASSGSENDSDGDGWQSLSSDNEAAGPASAADSSDGDSDSNSETGDADGWETASDESGMEFGSDIDRDGSADSGDDSSDGGSGDDDGSGSESDAESADSEDASAAAAAGAAPAGPRTIKEAEEMLSRQLSGQLEAQRLLTPKDFALLKQLQAQQAVEGGSRKRQAAAAAGADEPDYEAPLDVADIEVRKRLRATKEERLDAVRAGREGVEHKSNRGKDKGGGTTNKVKTKHKAFNMLKPKIAKKKRLGKREKVERRNAAKKRF